MNKICKLTTSFSKTVFWIVLWLFCLKTPQLQAEVLPTGSRLLNIDTLPPSPGKTGMAAFGLSNNDIWNGLAQLSGPLTISNLVWSDNTTSTVSAELSNAPGAWNQFTGDRMMDQYIYPFDSGNIVLKIKNLPPGNYDFIIYAHADDNSIAKEYVSKAGIVFGTTFAETKQGIPSYGWTSNSPWVENKQYFKFRSVNVSNGATTPVVLTIYPDLGGVAILNGLQIVLNPPDSANNGGVETLPSSSRLLNLDALPPSPPKAGFAAFGLSSSDFWNGLPQSSGLLAVTNLLWSDNSSSGISVVVSNAPGGWNQFTGDKMMDQYIYPFNTGNIVLTVNNLPPGNYDFIVYAHADDTSISKEFLSKVELSAGASFSQVKQGTSSYGWTTTSPWVENKEYFKFRSIPVAGGTSTPIVLTISPDQGGVAILNGLQIVLTSAIAVTPGTVEPLPVGARLLNIDTLPPSPPKTGVAAFGFLESDVWNGMPQTPGVLTISNLVWSDNSASRVSAVVSNAPGAWNQFTGDRMLDQYIYPFNGGNLVVKLNGLPLGTYDFIVYAHADDTSKSKEYASKAGLVSGINYSQVKQASPSYGWTTSSPWVENKQYFRFRSVPVTVGADSSVTLTIYPDLGGVAILSGIQVVLTSTNLILNGGFENGFAGWSFDSSAAIQGPPTDLAAGADGTHSALLGTLDRANSKITQLLNVQPNSSYRLRFAAAATTSGGPIVPAALRASANAAHNTNSLDIAIDAVPLLSGNYGFKPHKLTFDTLPSQSTALIQFEDKSPNSGIGVNPVIDQIELVKKVSLINILDLQESFNIDGQHLPFIAQGPNVLKYVTTTSNGLPSGNLFASGGMAELSGNIAFDYGARQSFIVELDAILPDDRLSIAVMPHGGTYRSPSALSIFFRKDSTVGSFDPNFGSDGLPGIGLFDGSQEMGLKSSDGNYIRTGVEDTAWHAYAVRFDKVNHRIKIYVDQELKADIDSSSYAGGRFDHYVVDAVGIGGNSPASNPWYVDNLRVGDSGTSTLSLSPGGQVFTNVINVSVVSISTNFTLRYTLDGTIPTASSALYSGPVSLASNTTFTALGFTNDVAATASVSEYYARIYVVDSFISDAWLTQYFGLNYLIDPRAASDADPDNDGSTNLQEFGAGTNPLDRLSGFKVTVTGIPFLSWPTVPNVSYQVLRRSTLGTGVFNPIATILATNQTSVYLDMSTTNSVAPWFYTIKVIP